MLPSFITRLPIIVERGKTHRPGLVRTAFLGELTPVSRISFSKIAQSNQIFWPGLRERFSLVPCLQVAQPKWDFSMVPFRKKLINTGFWTISHTFFHTHLSGALWGPM
jgi:hypothetical protein